MASRPLSLALATLTVALFGLHASRASADEAPVEVTLAPWAAYDGVERPFRYILRIAPRHAGPVEAVADRRLLSFQVRAPGTRRRRALRCRHPHTPRRPAGGRVQVLRSSDEGGGVYEEYVDLRMYCWGRALAALEAGGEVTSRYGFRRRTRAAWVARVPNSRWRDWTGGVDLPPFTFPATPQSTEAEPGNAGPASAVRVRLRDRSARRGGSLSLPVSVNMRAGSARVFVRPATFEFAVNGPLGTARCRLEGSQGHPAPDLYRRITTRYAARQTLSATQLCPEDTFLLPGIYELTPTAHLDHDGADYDLNALTGDFVGETAVVRITEGRRGYLVQTPERPEDDE
ncbi:MAG: hypothetical protein AB8I08_14455 [Sandaracinaceae bacterium]